MPQYQWAGVKLQNLEVFVCTRTCLDVPQMALKTIVIPADPLPVWRPLPEPFNQVEPSFIAEESSTFSGSDITTESGDDLIWEDGSTPLPDPNNPVLYYPDTASST